MFLRIVADAFGRRPRHKLLTGAALALGMGVATAALSVSLDVGDRLAKELRSLGANLLVTPQADSLPLEIGGVDYRPVDAGAYLPEADLPKLKTIFWHNNVIGFSPILEVRVSSSTPRWSPASATFVRPAADGDAVLIGTWSNHPVALPEGGKFITGLQQTSPWWRVEGSWFEDGAGECIVPLNFNVRWTLSKSHGNLYKRLLGRRCGRHLTLDRAAIHRKIRGVPQVVCKCADEAGGRLCAAGSEDDERR